jgi:hypothetical protein
LPQGENFAVFVGEFLQAFFQTLPPPFAGFGQHFTFNLRQTR